MSAIPKVRSRFDRLRVPARMASDIPDDARTRQEFAKECDINLIVRAAQRGVSPAFVNRATPRYGDFSDVPSLAEAFELVANAEEAFMTLPALARLELDNDFTRLQDAPYEFFERHGLLKEKETSTDVPSPGVSEGVVDPPQKASKKPVSDRNDQA